MFYRGPTRPPKLIARPERQTRTAGSENPSASALHPSPTPSHEPRSYNDLQFTDRTRAMAILEGQKSKYGSPPHVVLSPTPAKADSPATGSSAPTPADYLRETATAADLRSRTLHSMGTEELKVPALPPCTGSDETEVNSSSQDDSQAKAARQTTVSTGNLPNRDLLRRGSLGSRSSRVETLSGLASAAELRKRTLNQTRLIGQVDNRIAGIAPYLVSGKGHHHFTLPSSDLLAATRIYHRRWTVLPSAVSDIPCSQIQPAALLAWVNTIFETSFALTTGIERCLLEFIDDDCDLGKVYGYLRPWMPGVQDAEEFARFSAATLWRKEKDYALRFSAMNGHCITNPRIAPRRVWDLFANRVIPYYAIDQHVGLRGSLAEEADASDLPANLWAISHSWVAPSQRYSVLTTINGKAWRVPVPRNVTLDDIRDELLILGAEYVFLDILCLRQHDAEHPQLENIRKREWRLDIPTIGHVYRRPHSPVVVYFNGLGLPFRDVPEERSDEFHWFNRVWTVQETPSLTIVGGMEQKLNHFDVSKPDSWPRGLSSQLINALRERQNADGLFWKALRNIVNSSYANAVDQVAALGYLAGCKTLSIYDADLETEVAWGFLVECLPADVRLQLLFSSLPRSGSWRPTWAQILDAFSDNPKINGDLRCPSMYQDDEQLEHIDGSSPRLGYNDGLDANCHRAFVIEGCRINITSTRNHLSNTVSQCSVDIPLPGGNGYRSFRVTEWGDSISRESEYLLISVGCCLYWIVAEAVGVRRIDKERALEVLKVSTLTIPDTDRSQRGSAPNMREFSRRFVVYR